MQLVFYVVNASSADYVEAPIINILSPQNNTCTLFVTLSFNATVGRIIDPRVTAVNTEPVIISDVWYKGNWQENETHLSGEYLNKISIVFQTNITEVSAGNHSITVGVEEVFFDPDWPPVLPVRKSSFSTVTFTVSASEPSILPTISTSKQPATSPTQEPSPSIPEFPFVVLVLAMLAALVAAAALRHNRNRQLSYL